MKLEASTLLPTNYGNFLVKVYRNGQGLDVTAICSGTVEGQCDVAVRVHSACYTGETLGSLKCDCKDQLDFALTYIARHQGVVLYLPQEGRGIGLANKIRAYALQEQGYNTIQANEILELPVDSRTYEDARDILRDLRISSICLLTNNPAKIANLTKLGVNITGRIPVPSNYNQFSADYLETKRREMGHLIQVLPAVGADTQDLPQAAQLLPGAGSRPYIHINLAMNSQASTLSAPGANLDLSCARDWRRVHELREQYAAVAVGANTWQLDNPRLTVRAEVLGRKPTRQPARVIFSGNRTFQIGRAPIERESFLIGACAPSASATLTHIPCDDYNLAQPLSTLKEMGVSSMLVEGGLTLIGSFVRQQQVDLLTIYVRSDCITTATNAAIKAIPSLSGDEIEARRYGLGLLLSVSFSIPKSRQQNHGAAS